MPLLFAATLFVSASLLFMVQPMVGKMVLPLLGGSPAVWNACMLFFQALLLLGYLYSHYISGKFTAKKQWYLHLLVLALPLAAFILAVMFGDRHSPIAIAESFAPGAESNPVLSVLILLTVAIGIPFFVVSTSAPLLQKWFTCTGHPSSRDPYFLYSASNLGSMMLLLGYPLFIEPNMTIVGQAWVFAVGFTALAAMIVACGYFAANPIAVPPAAALPTGKSQFAPQQATKPAPKNGSIQKGNSPNDYSPKDSPVIAMPNADAPPTMARKLKWIALAFVPSSMMLGVTFYMATDIASIPLLWVGPLTLYLITFIIAFARLPDGFRMVIGNLAPVMMLLLVFVMISGIPIAMTLELGLYLITFFAAALMCHYELARDRPSPQYLTNFFLLMSVGGVLGGIFNSLVAPIVFSFAYEFPLILVIACLLVPRLTDDSSSEATSVEKLDEKSKSIAAAKKALQQYNSGSQRRVRGISLALDFAIPAAVGVGYYLLQQLGMTDWYEIKQHGLAQKINLSDRTILVILLDAVPVMLCFFFVDRPLRFALCVGAILGYSTYTDSKRGVFYSDRSFFGILKIESEVSNQRPIETTDKQVLPTGRIYFNKLVHGRILHGTQITHMDNNILDMFQCLTAMNPLDNFIVAQVNHRFDPRQEPLTYYHRSGPVGAMFHELRTRKGGTDAKAPFAMVGLGTGSVSCYALPGQKLTFYEIDRHVLRMVERPWMVMDPEVMKKDPRSNDLWKIQTVEEVAANTDPEAIKGPFTYVDDARRRGAEVEFQIGDARLKLKENTDRKYALLLVDAFSSDSIPVHLLTTEAVQLYFNRMTEDGILALHISNKFISLEPVVGAIAKKLGLAARVWNDDNELKGPGKTASSWVALAKKPEYLGGLYSELGDMTFPIEPLPNGDEREDYIVVETANGYLRRQYMDAALNQCLTDMYPKDLDQKNGKEKTRSVELNMSPSGSLNSAWAGWIDEKLQKVTDPRERERLLLYKDLIVRYGVLSEPRGIMLSQSGHAFRQLEVFHDVEAWTDDYSDVMRVMRMSELQKLRRFLGLPTPVDR